MKQGNDRVNSSDRLHLIVTVPIILACAVYFLNPPAPRYFPLENSWSLTAFPESPSMGWYGRTAWSLGVWLTAHVATRLLTATNGRSCGRVVTALLTTACVLSLVGLSVYIVWHEFGHRIE